ncbi:MAG: hypothetical protein KGI06_03805 [Candidatus Micrarchaeota archaeon]|nr:hypothetical protein [Candidatus Micrarchaeota archaeon]
MVEEKVTNGTVEEALDGTTKNDGDFITQFTQTILKDIQTYNFWAEDIATSLLSTCCSKVKAYSRIGQFRLNVWHIAIAPSGRGVKSAPFNHFLEPTLKELEKYTKADYKLPSSFSPESIVDYLKRQSYGIIARDEISKLFKETSGKGYTAQMIEIMSNMYDGKIDKRFTFAHGLNDIDDCYITLIGAATPYIYSVLEQSAFVQGLGNRILFEHYKIDRPVRNITDLFGDTQIHRLRADKIVEFAKMLYNIDKLENLTVEINPKSKAAELITKFDNTISERVNKGKESDIKKSYLDRSLLSVLKLSSLKAISSQYNTIEVHNAKDEIKLEVRVEDAQWAIDKVNRHLDSFDEMLKEWYTQPRIKPVESYEAYFETIKRTIADSPDKILTMEEIFNQIGWTYSGTPYTDGKGKIEAAVGRGDIRQLSDDEIKSLPNDTLARHKIDIKRRLPRTFGLNKNMNDDRKR